MKFIIVDKYVGQSVSILHSMSHPIGSIERIFPVSAFALSYLFLANISLITTG